MFGLYFFTHQRSYHEQVAVGSYLEVYGVALYDVYGLAVLCMVSRI